MESIWMQIGNFGFPMVVAIYLWSGWRKLDDNGGHHFFGSDST